MANTQIKEGLCLRGSVSIFKNGELVQEKGNLIVNVGRDYVASRITDGSSPIMGWIAVGTGAAAPASGDTALGNELTRKALNTGSPSRVANIVTFEVNYTAGEAVGVLTEAGLFNAAAAGDMLSHVQVGPFTMGASDTFAIVWNIEFPY